MGKKVHVYTGRALLWSIVKHDSRMARWALMLQEMDIRTNYIKGKTKELMSSPVLPICITS